MNVKRLAAIDMHGTRGTLRRRRIIAAEFIVGAIGAVAFGTWLICAADLGGRIFGLWAAGAGLNYAVLAGYAIALSRPGALAAELDGVDTGRELRRYGLLQFWTAVPLALAGLAAYDVLASRTSRTAADGGNAARDGTRLETMGAE